MRQQQSLHFSLNIWGCLDQMKCSNITRSQLSQHSPKLMQYTEIWSILGFPSCLMFLYEWMRGMQHKHYKQCEWIKTRFYPQLRHNSKLHPIQSCFINWKENRECGRCWSPAQKKCVDTSPGPELLVGLQMWDHLSPRAPAGRVRRSKHDCFPNCCNCSCGNFDLLSMNVFKCLPSHVTSCYKKHQLPGQWVAMLFR